jgi:ribokinase
MKKSTILVVGSSNTDMIIKCPRIPGPGETILGGEFFKLAGGKGANQAVAAARAGGDVTFIGCVGNDSMGKDSLEGLAEEGIDVSHVKVSEDKPSGIALINVSESGENSITVASGANGDIFPADVLALEDIIASAEIILLQHEIPFETVKEVILMAQNFGVKVILNPAPAASVPKELLSMIYLLTPNEHEAALITGMSSETDPLILADKLLEMGSKQVIITIGSKGALFADGEHKKVVETITVKAVDSTAAGDTFNGYLAVALARGDSMIDAIKLANKAASVSVTRMGAQASVPTIEEL